MTFAPAQPRSAQVPELELLINGLHEQKSAAELDVIEALLPQPERFPDANGMGLNLSSFEQDDLRLIYVALPFVAGKSEIERLGFVARLLDRAGFWDDGAVVGNRSMLWSANTLAASARTWPKGLTSLEITIPPLLKLNRRLLDGRAYFLCLMDTLRGL